MNGRRRCAYGTRRHGCSIGRIVILLGSSWLTQNPGRMELHFLCGYRILTLLLFRLAWGFVGSDTARFSRFLKSPLAALRHLAASPPGASRTPRSATMPPAAGWCW